MANQSNSILVSEDYLADLEARGQAIYETKLKSLLEPAHNNEYVVIHVDTEDYAVNKSFTRANRAMMLRRPVDGRLFGRKIGPEPDNDFIARMVSAELVAGRVK